VLKSRTRQYRRGAVGIPSTLGKVCTYVSQHLSDRMRSRMCDPESANQKLILQESIFDEGGQPTLTLELAAQMSDIVSSSRPHSPADSKESRTSTRVSKKTLDQRRRRRRKEERRNNESKSNFSAGPSSRGTACPDGDPSDKVPGGFTDEEEDEFWPTEVNEKGGVVSHG